MQDTTLTNNLEQKNTDNKEPIKLKFLTYNIFLRPPLINNNGDDYKDLRCNLFMKKFMPDYDFIHFQELFSKFNNRKKNLVKEAYLQNFKWSAKCPNPPFLSSFFIDSGLLTISKYEIVVKKFLPYKYKAGVDGAAFKGCIYCKVKIREDTFLHLFNTHTQASYSTEYTKDQHDHFQARLNQILLCQEFINDCLERHSDLPTFREAFLSNPEKTEKWKDYVIIAGDMNVDGNGKPIPFNFRLHNLNAAIFVGIHKNFCGVNLSKSMKMTSAEDTADLVIPNYNYDENGSETERKITENQDTQIEDLVENSPLDNFLKLDPKLQNMLKFNKQVDPDTGDQIISNLTEYKFMQYVLSDFDESILVDFHVLNENQIPDERNDCRHPITYGDVKIDENGKEMPRETQLTNKEDLAAKMCLDYVLQFIPCVNVQGKKIPLGNQLKVNSKVKEFFVDFQTEGQGKVVQTSDHYGVELEFTV